MRIAIVIESLDTRRGGAEAWTWQYVQWLQARGLDVHVLACGFGAEAERLGISRHVLPPRSSRCALAAAFAERLKRLQPNIVHDMGCGWHCDVFQPHGGSRQAAFEQNLRLLPHPIAALKRRVAPLLPRYRDFARLTFRQYSGRQRLYVALSQMVAMHMQQYHGVSPQQIRVIYNGVDVNRFSPLARIKWRQPVRDRLGIADDELLVLIVAHNHRLKGVPALQRAVCRLKRLGCPIRLLVAGGQHHAPMHSARRGVLYLGPVHDPAPLYAAADVYAHPTWYDPCSLVVLEALASGLPVVTTRCNGASELMRDGQQGYLLDDPADVNSLAVRLQSLLDGDLRARMGQCARTLAEAHTLARNFRQLAAIYEEIAQRRTAA